jgi:GntR family transcriptional regulator
MAGAGHVLRWEDTVSERAPVGDERARLGLAPDQHVLLVWRRCYNQEDRILEVTRRAIRADRSPVVYRYG